MKTIQELRIITNNAQKESKAPLRRWAKNFVESCSNMIECNANRGFYNVTVIIEESVLENNLRWSYSEKEKQVIVAQEFAKYGFKVKCLTDVHRINISWEDQDNDT